jgi:hypothetical protein
MYGIDDEVVALDFDCALAFRLRMRDDERARNLATLTGLEAAKGAWGGGGEGHTTNYV